MASNSTTTIPFDSETLELLGLIQQYKAVIYVQLGIVIWEYLTTLPWELSVLTGRRPFRKPMVIFFAARYSMWLAIIPNLIQLRTSNTTDCRAVFDVLTVGATLQVVFGQLVFILRCLSIWEWAPWVICIFLAELTPYIAFSFAIFQGTRIGSVPDLTPGMISCQILNYGWPFLVSYSMCVLVDLTTAGLMTFKVMSIRKTLRSTMLQMFLREGLLYSALGLVPAVIVLAFFGRNDKAAIRGAGLTLCSMLHAVLGCRAFISLDSYAERLPTSLQGRVKNGEMLDADTLARIAFHTGLPRPSGLSRDDTLGPSLHGHGSESKHQKVPWAIRLARLGLKTSPEEKAAGLRSNGSGHGHEQHSQSQIGHGASGVGAESGTPILKTPDGQGQGLGRASTYTVPAGSLSSSSYPTPRFTNTNFPGAHGTPNLDGIIISEQQVVEEDAGGRHEDDEGLGFNLVASPLSSWAEHGSNLGYAGGRREDGRGPGLGLGARAGESTSSFEGSDLKLDMKRSP
ncbi:unnamed protein product [Tilletia controversa]|uniref:Transmembrane protein n=3 Tax=Tilletia TaxID=13289 RepID=A0A8X7MV82_9BASI|nr:hypothetical protein CF336_g2566 [Tilletia laevis]KAE8202150.1 hypothetical protein CF328_g2379 [Tilletia controversa]KAE8262970.1 hypothetical protein A4X03_0g2028 [Tilletia caries]KAE8206612.1 hypothetical protein CF335_g1750 [Tilletia laevis]KAE8249759.1 hypothetical protein A4X06_0g3084 [Tilletia controversa]